MNLKTTFLICLIITLFLPEWAFTQGNKLKPDADLKLAASQFKAYISSKPSVLRKNLGQWESHVTFRTSANGGTISLLKNGVSYHYSRESEGGQVSHGDSGKYRPMLDTDNDVYVWNTEFLGINTNVLITSSGEVRSNSNYFLGNNQRAYVTKVPDYNVVNYKNIYDNISVRYYKNEGDLKYDFVLSKGADIKDIKVKAHGVKSIEINRNNELEIETDWGVLVETIPVSYQYVDGALKRVDVRYELVGENTYGFKIYGDYDSSFELVIDPIVVHWATYIGVTDKSARSYIFGVGRDQQGNVYGAGKIQSIITTPTSYDPTFNGGVNDVFVIKLNPDGTKMLFSTYVGGAGTEWGTGLFTDDAGNCYVGGLTQSADFPTVNAYQSVFNKGVSTANAHDAFLFKLDNTGSVLEYSTFIGGSDLDLTGGDLDSRGGGTISGFFRLGDGVTVNSAGEAFLTGYTLSNDFPVTSGSGVLKGNMDAFIIKLSADGKRLLHSELISGSNTETGRGASLNKNGELVVVGSTNSFDFTTSGNAYKKFLSGGTDVYVKKYKDTQGAGISPVYSTLSGGSGNDDASSVVVSETGEAYLTGWTTSPNLGTIGSYSRGADAFVMKINNTGSSMDYATYLGGIGDPDIGTGIDVDSKGNAYVTGHTLSSDFPLVCEFDNTRKSAESFVSKLSPTGAIEFSSFLGGDTYDYGSPRIKVVEESGCVTEVIISVTTHSDENSFPITPGVYYPQKLNNDTVQLGGSVTIARKDHPAIVVLKPELMTDFEYESTCGNNSVSFKDLTNPTSQCVWGNNWSPTSYIWDFGDGSTSVEKNPTHEYASSGNYTVKLTIGCPAVTVEKEIIISQGGSISANVNTKDAACGVSNGSATVSLLNPGLFTLDYQWDDPNKQTTSTASGLAPGTYTVVISDPNGCLTSTTETITINGGGGFETSVSVIIDDGCDRFGGALGNATVYVSGGNPPYTYQWNDPLNQSSQTATGLSPGKYMVTVTDVNGCTSLDSAIVEEKIMLSFTTNVSPCESCNNGEITVNVNGTGRPPFTYRWSDSDEQTTATATGLTPGKYTVTVTDADGCFRQETITIGVVGVNDIAIDHSISVYPNPSSGSFTIKQSATEIIEVSVYNTLGELIRHADYAYGIKGNIKFNIPKDGIYFLYVHLTNGVAVKRIQVLK